MILLGCIALGGALGSAAGGPIGAAIGAAAGALLWDVVGVRLVRAAWEE